MEEPRKVVPPEAEVAARHLATLERRRDYLLRTANNGRAFEECSALTYVLERSDCLLNGGGEDE